MSVLASSLTGPVPIRVGKGGVGATAGAGPEAGDVGQDSTFASSTAIGGTGGSALAPLTPSSITGGASGYSLSDNTTNPPGLAGANYAGGSGITYTSYTGMSAAMSGPKAVRCLWQDSEVAARRNVPIPPRGTRRNVPFCGPRAADYSGRATGRSRTRHVSVLPASMLRP
jgi:hypothetical protein